MDGQFNVLPQGLKDFHQAFRAVAADIGPADAGEVRMVHAGFLLGPPR